ncbi:MAG: SHOCT domain-containing protein [Chitinophagaceae bacterium]|nr:SHOCT domain-containing protein [Chitinophagaceae bacterium]
MKKFFGTLFLIIGLIIVTISSIAATELDCEKRKFLYQARTELGNTSSNIDSQQTTAVIAVFFGLLLFIIGLVLVLTKSKKQHELEAEVAYLKNGKEIAIPQDNITELEQLFELKQKGVLTEEEFSKRKKKILE